MKSPIAVEFKQTRQGWNASLFVLFALFCGGFSALGQPVPAMINYQGRLANPDGSALATADYMLSFRIYNGTNSNANLIWGAQIFHRQSAPGHGPLIPVMQGYFNVMLGPADITNASLAGAFTGYSRYVEITVTNHPPISPRQAVLSVPFAFQAANSAALAGTNWAPLFGTNDPINGQLQGARIAGGNYEKQTELGKVQV